MLHSHRSQAQNSHARDSRNQRIRELVHRLQFAQTVEERESIRSEISFWSRH